MDQITIPSQWIALIRKTNQVTTFKIICVENPLTDDLKNDFTPIVKVKITKPFLIRLHVLRAKLLALRVCQLKKAQMVGAFTQPGP